MQVEDITENQTAEYSVYDGHSFYRVTLGEETVVTDYNGATVKNGTDREDILTAVMAYRAQGQ